MENPVKIIYTMFESDKIPDDWLDFLHTADKVLVPSRWCMEVFAKSGIQAEVVPLGYDDSVFSFEQRKLKNLVKENFTFLHYNAYNVRKGFLEVVKAFITEFDPAEPVRMIFKTVQEQLPALPLIPSQYPNIEIVKGAMEDTDLAKLCARADCFVYPSRGEGFGIPPLEAMATGMPAIVPNAHGISEYFDPQYMYEVKVEKTCPALYSRYRGATDEETIEKFGNMVVCDTDDLRRQMRYIYEHQRDAMEMGQRASEYVKNYTYKKTAERLKTIIDDYMLKEVTKKPLANVLTLEEVK
jgi:glycosyltransferase involved in cell wall biosynthesis